jgi:hypothetical protein
MKLFSPFYALILVLFLASCTSPNVSPRLQTNTNQAVEPQVVTLDENIKVAAGQTIYVPVYSHIYFEDKKNLLNLAVTLSIRNTDLGNPIIITSVRYYDSDGKLVKQYLERPLQLRAMASTDFVVSRTDTSGGSGANFIVEWVAGQAVSDPVVEAVMISTEYTQGISFISPGRVMKTQNNYQSPSSKSGS